MLQNAQGEILTSLEIIKDEIVRFYKNLLGSCALSLAALDLTTIRAVVLSLDTIASLIQPITIEEFDRALHEIDDNKAPGIDGFNALFFKRCWHIIKHDVYRGVIEFFEHSYLHKQHSITLLLLWWPKCPQLFVQRISDQLPVVLSSIRLYLRYSLLGCRV